MGLFQAWLNSSLPRRGPPNSLSVQEWQANKGAPRVQLKLKSFCFPLRLMDLNVTFLPLF